MYSSAPPRANEPERATLDAFLQDVSKLLSEYPDLPEIHKALEQMFIRMRKQLGLDAQ